MRKLTSFILFITFFGAVLLLLSCKKKGDTQVSPVYTDLEIHLVHHVDGAAVDFDNIQYLNAFGNPYSVVRLQYFISDIRLTASDGTTILIDEEFYVDARDATTLKLIPQTKILTGSYIGVDFVFGLTEVKNVAGRFPNPPENNMEWPPVLGTGYHYMKLEGKVDSAGYINNFQAHTGPTFGNQNFIAVSLPGVSFTTSEGRFAILMDINKWWVNPNTIDLNTMTMVMGKQEVQQQLHDNGMDAFSFQSLISIHKSF